MPARERQVFEIDATKPLNLLVVESQMDNTHYKFCADEVVTDDGRYLEDDELTYNDFVYGPEAELPAGTKLRIPYLWGFEETGLSAPTDFVMTLPKAATVKHIVYVMLSQYHVQMQAINASARYYFVEQVGPSRTHEDEIEIVLGT